MNRRRAPVQSRGLYRMTGLLVAALWLTGMLWLALHYFAARVDEFGVTHHPLESPVLLVHGIAALATLFVLGWFAARHAGAMSGRRHSRTSGWLLSGYLLLLAGAGCAQFFLVNETWQAAASLVHEISGAALLLPVLLHLLRFRNADRPAARAGIPEHRHAHGRRHAHADHSPRPHSVRN
jgi:heme A synthase